MAKPDAVSAKVAKTQQPKKKAPVSNMQVFIAIMGELRLRSCSPSSVTLSRAAVVAVIVAFALFAPSKPESDVKYDTLVKKAKGIEELLKHGKREAALEALHDALNVGVNVPEFHYNIAIV